VAAVLAVCAVGRVSRFIWGGGVLRPTDDIVITNFVWCMAYKRGVGRGVVECAMVVP